VAGRDITEGRANRSIAVDVGVVSSTAIWQNTDMSYDVAIGGLPFFYAINDSRPYIRQTAPFRKDQFDNGTEPGEQSLTGWWIRSQASFHSGAGIKFYDPATTDENGHYRFAESKGVDVWTKGQVTLLNNCTATHETTGAIASNGNVQQHVRSIKWNSTSGVLLHDEYDVDKIAVDGTLTHFIDYNSGTDAPVYAICDDGTYAYWITNTATKKTVYKKPLTGSSASTADVVTMFDEVGLVTNAAMEYVKDRIVMCANNKVFEFSTSASAMPTAVYTHPTTSHVYTSVAASGPAIYISGYNGIQSTIQKFTLSTAGVMPTLTSAVVAAELPVGEIVHKIHYYLGYMLIGTNKGVRVAAVSDQDGSLNYGPLIVETSQPCYDFASRDHYVWCATGVGSDAGVIRLDLSNEVETLRFAWANDLYMDGVTGHVTTGCAFANGTDRLVFVTAYADSAAGGIYIEDESTLRTSGYLTTGNIRYGTLEPKNFKRLLGRGNFTYGSMTLETVDKDGIEYDHISYDASVPSIEVGTSQPATAQEYVAYKFILYRDGTDTTKGPTFKGYQAKATIATPRQRIIQFPIYCYDLETDRYNSMIGYEGKAFEKILALEEIEEEGDVLTWQDLTTGESRQAVIEQISFQRATPPDKRFSGFGGVINVTIRTV
jgi:flagellar hook protein FlgE